MDFSDRQIADLIAAARFLLKCRAEFYTNENYDPYSEAPPYYWNYLQIRGVVKDFMKKRRQHRKNVNHIWKVYADSVIASREAKA